MQALTIGQVARQSGVSIETVRFYERAGLIDEPPRNRAGYRQYPVTSVSRVRFIRGAKGLGFSLKEVRELLALQARPGASSGEVKARAEAKIADIATRIRALQRMKDALVLITASCDGCAPVRECPVLNAFEAKNHEPECC